MYSNAYKNSLGLLGLNRSLKIDYCTITPQISSFNVSVNIPYVELLNKEFVNVHPVVVYCNTVVDSQSTIDDGDDYSIESGVISSLTFEEFLRLFEIYIYNDYLDNDDKRLLLEGFLFEYNMYNKLIVKINNLILKYKDTIQEGLKNSDIDLFITSLSNHLVNSYIQDPSSIFDHFWETAVRKPTGKERSLYALIKNKIFEPHRVDYILNNLQRIQSFKSQYMDYVVASLFDSCILDILLDKIPSLYNTKILKEIKRNYF